MSSKGFEFSFGWLFAIIVGAAILALAIYATSSFINTQRGIEDSTQSVEVSSLLRQIETGLEESGTNTLKTPVKTRITNGCSLTGNTVSERVFGVQSIKSSASSKIGDEWEDEGVPLRTSSIYLFSNKTIEGTSFTTLSMRFEYPYKIGDVLIMWPSNEKYCFVNSPLDVENALSGLNIIGINFSTSTQRCASGSKKVCFAQTGCDVDVSIPMQMLTKNRKTVYFDSTQSALFYAAIFSDPEIYNCQVTRLAKKGAALADIYAEKARFGPAYGCSADTLLPALLILGEQLNATRDSSDIIKYIQTMEELKRNNDALICPIF